MKVCAHCLIAIIFVVPVCANDLCSKYETERTQLSIFEKSQHQILMKILRPGNGKYDPRFFLMEEQKRREKFPDIAAIYTENEQAIIRAINSNLHLNKKYNYYVMIVEGGWVYFKIFIPQNGESRVFGGEPDYGIILEISNNTDVAPRALGVIQPKPYKCNGTYVQEFSATSDHGESATIAIPLFEQNGVKAGEVQLIISAEE